jgi:hypothetical protein
MQMPEWVSPSSLKPSRAPSGWLVAAMVTTLASVVFWSTTVAAPDESLETIDAGSQSSLVLDAAGNPVISYTEYGIDEGLRLAHCNDPNCASTETSSTNSSSPVPLPDGTLDTGNFSSLVLDAAGNPVISYSSPLRLLHCGDPNCAGTETPQTVDATGGEPSLVLDAAGNPVISYDDRTNGDLRLAHCNDPNCAGTAPPAPATTTSIVGGGPSGTLPATGGGGSGSGSERWMAGTAAIAMLAGASMMMLSRRTRRP